METMQFSPTEIAGNIHRMAIPEGINVVAININNASREISIEYNTDVPIKPIPKKKAVKNAAKNL